MGYIVPRMENWAHKKAEFARGELRAMLLGRYPSVKAVAEALDVPYASVHRYLSLRSKEQREVPFWFLIQSLQILGMSFDEFMARVDAQAAKAESPSK